MPKTGQAAVVGGRRVSRRGRKIERDAKHVCRRNSSAMAFEAVVNASSLGRVRLSLTHVRGAAQEDAEPEGYEDELSEWAHYLHTFADEAEESSDEPEDEPVTPVASPKGSPKREKFNKPTPAHTFKKFSLDGGAGMKGVRRAGESWRPHEACSADVRGVSVRRPAQAVGVARGHAQRNAAFLRHPRGALRLSEAAELRRGRLDTAHGASRIDLEVTSTEAAR